MAFDERNNKKKSLPWQLEWKKKKIKANGLEKYCDKEIDTENEIKKRLVNSYFKTPNKL